MNQTIRLVLDRTPPSVNHAYLMKVMKGRILRFPTKENKQYKELFRQEYTKKYPDEIPFKSDCDVIIRVYYSDKRKRDVDNVGKVVLDSMNKLVFEDDSQVQKLTLEKAYCKEKPRTEVIISR